MKIRELLETYQCYSKQVFVHFKGIDNRYCVYDLTNEDDYKLLSLEVYTYQETLLSDTLVKLNIELNEKQNDTEKWARLLEVYYLYIDNLRRLNGEHIPEIDSEEFDV